MKTTVALAAFILILGMGISAPATSAERGSSAKAQAMVARAIKTFDALGPKVAFAKFHEQAPQFKFRDLYIFVLDHKGIVVAHAGDRKRLGLDAATLKDIKGAAYGQSIINNATPDGVWIDYFRKDPITQRELAKSSWIRRHQGYIFGVGVYKE